jgi:hypothetical protein
MLLGAWEAKACSVGGGLAGLLESSGLGHAVPAKNASDSVKALSGTDFTEDLGSSM